MHLCRRIRQWCAHVSIIENNNLQGQTSDMSAEAYKRNEASGYQSKRERRIVRRAFGSTQHNVILLRS
jgi:hypothetical protein